MGSVVSRQDHLDHEPHGNLSQEYEREKREGETYEQWVQRKSDDETTKFFIFLIVIPPLMLVLMAIILILFGE